MTTTEKTLSFLNREISSRKEQQEFLADTQGEHRENHSKGRELFLKLSDEIEILESLRDGVLDEERRILQIVQPIHRPPIKDNY